RGRASPSCLFLGQPSWVCLAYPGKVRTASGFAPRLARVQRLDLVRVLLRDRLALQLHGRCQLVAAGLPFGGEDLELLDLLDAGHLLVRLVDLGLDRLDDLLVLRERAEVARVRVDATLLEEARNRVGIERDERDVVRPPVADRDRLTDQRPGGLDVG